MPLNKVRLKLVPEQEARGRVREIYSEIKETLGVPHVNVIFQAYGAHPDFLEMHWQKLQPIVADQKFFDLAQRLRAEAYTRMHNYFRVPDLCQHVIDIEFTEGARHELTDAVELFHYNNPPLLLIASLQMQAFERGIGAGTASVGAEHPVFHNKPILIEEAKAPPATRRIYDEIKRTFSAPVVNTDYRALARWPDFLADFWSTLRPLAQSPMYSEAASAMRQSAAAMARELPAFELTASHMEDAGLASYEINNLAKITEMFVRILSELVLNISVAKIGLEGGNARQDSRVPAA